LHQSTNTSILFCTATQPGLDKLEPEYSLPLSPKNEIIPDIVWHFKDLKRVELIDKIKPEGWTLDEAAAFIENLDERSILTVVNTKPQAQKLYAVLSQKHPDWQIIHLSTNMCPAHRRKVIAKLRRKLLDKTQKCVCISTRLIEAGIDIDFDAAIRFLAGFDSVIQTAGRCNRNGKLTDPEGNLIIGKTYILNIVKDEENITKLPDLNRGQEIMRRILDEFHEDEVKFDHTLLHPELIKCYFWYYYSQMPNSLLKYTVFPGREDTLLDLLSNNWKSVQEYSDKESQKNGDAARQLTTFCQSFETAWKKFEVIAEDTIGVIVPFKQGRDIITELYTLPDIKQCEVLLAKAQRYSVNIYFSGLERLVEIGIVKQIPTKDQLEIYAVEEGYYDKHIGLTHEAGTLTMLNA
jgi:CRISPR-associated endonuclease/helicase Cas3